MVEERLKPVDSDSEGGFFFSFSFLDFLYLHTATFKKEEKYTCIKKLPPL